jgi:hypothetical protein
MSAVPTTAERVLQHLAGHTSKKPAREGDLLALVGGAEADFWAAIEALRSGGAINTAHIQRAGDPAPWLALWPTGLPVQHRSWKDLNALGCFAVQHIETPRRFPQSPAARRDLEETRTMPKNKRPRSSAEDRRNRIAELVQGRPIGQGFTVAEVAEQLDLTYQGVGYLLESMLCLRVAKGRVPGERADRLYDPAASMAAVVPERAPAPQQAAPAAPGDEAGPRIAQELAAIADAIGDMEPEPAPCIAEAAAQVAQVAATPARIEFALWDDGRVSIYDGDTLLMLHAADTVRLARLLGVHGHALAGEVAA